jgi:predicted nucleotidyltransferase
VLPSIDRRLEQPSWPSAHAPPRPTSFARIAQALADLRRRYPIHTIGVFGSWARGEQSPESDVDLLVTFSEPVGLFAYLELKEELEAPCSLR